LIGKCAAALAALALIVGSSGVAAAQGRRRFEPTDLRLQPAGTAEIDLQGGPVTGEDGQRAFIPDFEASLGIGSHVELELDGTFGLDDYTKPIFLDNTLIAVARGDVRRAGRDRIEVRVVGRHPGRATATDVAGPSPARLRVARHRRSKYG
jgi:hypothetical protein